MKIGIVRGGATKEEVLSKKFNIYMGVSLGNRWFQNKNNLKEYILWGLAQTKERFAIEIADTLQAINFQYRDGYSANAARRKALKEGDEFVKIFKEILAEMPPKDAARVDIIRWDEITANEDYRKKVAACKNFFETNKEFREEIRSIIIDFIAKIQRNWNIERVDKLALYALEEMPECMYGFMHNKLHYNCWVYPNDGGKLMQLIEDIQLKKRFKEIHKMFEIGDNIFVELIVE